MSHACDATCADCVRARQHAVLRAGLTADDALDDITRAQIWSGLAGKLGPPRPRARRWWLATAAVAAIAAVAIVVVHQPAARPAFTAPRDATLSMQLGHLRASLVGPAGLDVLDPSPAATRIALRSGTLLGDFAGAADRALTILAADATIEIVGTLFAVEIDAGAACVSVAHGTVRFASARGVEMVGNGQRACSDRRPPSSLSEAMRRALAHHAIVVADLDGAPAAAPAATAATASPVASASRVASASNTAPPAVTPSTITTPAITTPAITTPAITPSTITTPAITASAPRPASAAPARPARIASAEAARSAPPLASASSSTEPASSAQSSPPALEPLAPPASAASLYRDAERALAAGDLARADHQLASLLDLFPESALLDQALYERARIAYRRHAWADAQRQLDRLATITASPLAETGGYLACRIAVEAGDGNAEPCLARYRERYPRSPHDVDLLAMLVELAFRRGGCGAARAHIAELVRVYPDRELARRWRERCPATP